MMMMSHSLYWPIYKCVSQHEYVSKLRKFIYTHTAHESKQKSLGAAASIKHNMCSLSFAVNGFNFFVVWIVAESTKHSTKNAPVRTSLQKNPKMFCSIDVRLIYFDVCKSDKVCTYTYSLADRYRVVTEKCSLHISRGPITRRSFPRAAFPRDDAQGCDSARYDTRAETYSCATSRGNASRGKDRRVVGPQLAVARCLYSVRVWRQRV